MIIVMERMIRGAYDSDDAHRQEKPLPVENIKIRVSVHTQWAIYLPGLGLPATSAERVADWSMVGEGALPPPGVTPPSWKEGSRIRKSGHGDLIKTKMLQN